MIIRGVTWAEELNAAAFGFQYGVAGSDAPPDWPAVGAQSDPLRLRILKLLSAAFEQIDGEEVRWFTDLSPVMDGDDNVVYRRVRRGFSEIPQSVPEDVNPFPMVHIRERPLADINDRRDWYAAENATVLELLIQGFPYVESGKARHDITDEAYKLMDDLRGRLSIIALDGNERTLHNRRVFQIGGRENSVLSLRLSDGTVEANENNYPACYLRVGIELMENQANSTLEVT